MSAFDALLKAHEDERKGNPSFVAISSEENVALRSFGSRTKRVARVLGNEIFYAAFCMGIVAIVAVLQDFDSCNFCSFAGIMSGTIATYTSTKTIFTLENQKEAKDHMFNLATEKAPFGMRPLEKVKGLLPAVPLNDPRRSEAMKNKVVPFNYS